MKLIDEIWTMISGIIGFILIAGFCGFVMYLIEKHEEGVKATPYEAIVRILGCMMTGVIAGWLCRAGELGDDLTNAIVAAAGLAGAKFVKDFVDALAQAAKERAKSIIANWGKK